ncbi:hypothetical protein JMN32_14040 [Fulvivirga sp. 29W222]|uniref:Uncharacterized protein n=1 Tax=Fulvivirga marina TaxID=2494733 RepID=A0A937FWP0_9BACT|nr:hypothetical protein [Fulvivirga marina]MBL6447434.1 hypothetical protein [Fulvivirga marina]
MITKELFAIKFETDDKSGSGFLLQEINSLLLICKGPVLKEEFKLIIEEGIKQIERTKVRTCIADFGLMNIGGNASHVKNDFHENVSAVGVTELAIVLPINSTNGECIQNASESQAQAPGSLVAYYSFSLSDALLWVTNKKGKPVSFRTAIIQMKERVKFAIGIKIK